MTRTAPLLLLTVLAATPAPAQQDTQLVAAVRLATEGRGDSARAIVRRLLASLAPTDALYGEALFTLGVVTADPEEATRAFQRVVVEHGLSPWADDALLRLMHLSYAAGDPAASLAWLERLRRDHPASPLRAEAAYWGARTLFDLRDEARGCTLLSEGLSTVGDDVELRSRLAFYHQRCTTAPDTTSRPPPSAPYFTVQVLASNNVAAADAMLTRLRNAGFEASVQRDADGLLKVRVGRHPTRAAAAQSAARIRQRLGVEVFVVEVQP